MILSFLFSCSQFLDSAIFCLAKVIFSAPSYGHVSTHRAQSIHLDSVTSPPFFSYMAVACVGQTRLQIPHLVHFSWSLLSFVRAICLNGVNELNIAVKPPRGHIRHQNLLYANAKIVTMIRIATLIEVK